MTSLDAELERARSLSVDELADAVESIGFECTRCGACCRGHGDEHTATVFPDEVRTIQEGLAASADGPADGEDGQPYDWRDVARPMPFGLSAGEGGTTSGETFEWALQTDSCGDCAFYREDDDGVGACGVHADRPLICETYPFSVDLGGRSQPMGAVVDGVALGPQDDTGELGDAEETVRAHECEGLGRDIDRADAESLAAALKERAVRELEEAIGVRDAYEPVTADPGAVVVHDSEGAKRPDGSEVDE